MAETPPKRHREEPQEPQILDSEDANPSTKRQKPYNTILSLLEEEEDETEPSSEPPSEDLSAMFTTLQQELSSSTSCDSTAFDDFDFIPYTAVEVAELAAHHQKSNESSTSAVGSPRSGDGDGDGEDEGAKSVMRHLLEASDDELGIPNRSEDNDDVGMKSGENFPFALSDHGLWELEDETANYYTVLQSELFM